MTPALATNPDDVDDVLQVVGGGGSVRAMTPPEVHAVRNLEIQQEWVIFSH